jgi:hypothetical protein
LPFRDHFSAVSAFKLRVRSANDVRRVSVSFSAGSRAQQLHLAVFVLATQVRGFYTFTPMYSARL